MRRKIYQELLQWKQRNGESALLVQGARRVGKSYIVEAFAKAEYKSYILIDFNLVDQQVKEMFEHDLVDLKTFFMKLTTYYGVKLYERESLIIFDEVQLFPRARSAIKYLVADGRYDYIETGSLISIRESVKDILIPSEEDHVDMYPLDFEEFLWANGNDTMMDFIRDCYRKKAPLGRALHRKAMDLFRQYLIVGGMPQAVNAFVKHNDFDEVDRVKRRILNLYRDDIRKHAKGYEMKGQTIARSVRLFSSVPPHRPQNRVPRYQRQRLPAAAQANIASSATQRRSAPVEKNSQPSGSVSGASAR